ALKGQMPEKFPQAFAELARNTLDILEEVQHKHRQQSDSGEGWYLVARPDRPYWPVALEQAARRAIETEVSLDMAAQELKQLREIEAGKEYGDDLGRVLYEAIEQLAIRLLPHYPELGFAPIVRHLVKPIGPVFEQWKQTLTPISDKEVEELKATRRFTRLLADEIEPQVGDDFISKARECIGSCWRDPIGRLVVELQKTTSEGTTVFAVEWPTTLPHEWNEETILASDPEMSGTLFAISSALDGNLRVDPVPNPGAEPNYSWGYEGTSPWNLYWALFRCACGLYASQNNEWKGDRLDALYEQSKLWRYITTLDGDAPFRLRWSQIQAWVHEDSRSLERINGN
ncbi:MAG: hypothetical protein ACREN8_08670, partial [Candidatus Dormibacteraceae bacterium]